MSVRELLQTNEEAAIEKFKKEVAPLKLNPGAEEKLITMFKAAFSPSVSQESEITWDYVKPLTPNEQFPYENLPDPSDPSGLLNQLVVCKLNGGLGTTMGCTFPKSLIVCKSIADSINNPMFISHIRAQPSHIDFVKTNFFPLYILDQAVFSLKHYPIFLVLLVLMVFYLPYLTP